MTDNPQSSVEYIAGVVTRAGEAMHAATGHITDDHLEEAQHALYVAGATEAATSLEDGLAVRDSVVAAGNSALTSLHAYVVDIGAGVLSDESIGQSSNAERHEQHPEVVVVYRRIGETRFKIALSIHSVENGEAIAGALRGSDLLALEQVGGKNAADRQEHADWYTSLIAADADPEEVQQTLARVGPSSPQTAALLKGLIGSNKQVIFLDVGEDDPEFAIYHKHDHLLSELSKAVAYALPLPQVRALTHQSLIAMKAMCHARDRVIARQLAAIAQEVGDAEIGVLLGALHFGALEGMAPDRERADPWPLREHLDRSLQGTFSHGHVSMIADEITDRHIDRAALSAYLGVHVSSDEQAKQLVSQLNDESTRRVLEDLDFLTRSSVNHIDRMIAVNDYLKTLTKLDTQAT